MNFATKLLTKSRISKNFSWDVCIN